MIEPIIILEEHSTYIGENQALFSFIITVLSGEFGSYILGTFAERKYLSIEVVLLVVPITIITIDIVIYSITLKLNTFFSKYKPTINNRIIQKIKHYFSIIKLPFLGKQVTTLLLLKLIPGSKALIVPYALFYKMPLRRFIYLDSVVTVSVCYIIIFISWFVATGLLPNGGTYDFLILIVYIIVTFILIHIFGRKISVTVVCWIEKLLDKKKEKSTL